MKDYAVSWKCFPVLWDFLWVELNCLSDVIWVGTFDVLWDLRIELDLYLDLERLCSISWGLRGFFFEMLKLAFIYFECI
jgi:hypothetical protein